MTTGDRGYLTKLFPWAVTVIFAAGGALASHQNALNHIEDLEQQLESHASDGAHAGAETRLTLLESRLRAVELERESVSRDIREIQKTQGAILRQLAAVCSATGARCERTP